MAGGAGGQVRAGSVQGRRRGKTRAPSSAEAPPRLPGLLERHGVIVVCVLAAIYVVAYGGACLQKYRNFLYADFDLAIFVQAVDGLLTGSLHSSIRGMNWLGDHSSLVMFLLAPIYAIARHPTTLLALQTVALALGALPVYWLARRKLPGGLAPVALAAAYLLHPALGYTNLFEFHPEAFSTSALLFAFYGLVENRLRWVAISSALALLGKEDVALAVLGMALYALSLRRLHQAGLLAGLAAASLIVSFGILKPTFGIETAQYDKLYSEWGDTSAQVAWNILRDPGRALAAFWETPGDLFDTSVKRNYYLLMLLPYAFLPVLSPRTLLIASPVVAAHFLGWRFQQHTIVFQYTALVAPFVAAAAVLGLRNLLKAVPPGTRSGHHDLEGPSRRGVAAAAGWLVIVASVAANIAYGPFVGGGSMMRVRPAQSLHPSAHDASLLPFRNSFLAQVPERGGVVAGFEFLARLVRGHEVHSLHHLLSGRYTASDRPYAVPTGVEAVIADMGSAQTVGYLTTDSGTRLGQMLEHNRLRLAAAAGDLVLFLRNPADSVEWISTSAGAPRTAAAAVYDSQLRLVGFDPVDTTIVAGQQVMVRTTWRRVAPVDRFFAMRLALVNARGEVAVDHSRLLGYGLQPPQEWAVEATVRETGRLLLPLGLPPGSYRLEARMEWKRAFLGHGDCEVDDPAMRVLHLGRVVVTGPTGVLASPVQSRGT